MQMGRILLIFGFMLVLMALVLGGVFTKEDDAEVLKEEQQQ